MNTVFRKASLTLLILIVIGLGTVSAHTATHATADQLTCDLCTGQGNPAHAIPPALSLQLLPQIQFFADGDVPVAFVSVTRPAYQQRAPPATYRIIR